MTVPMKLLNGAPGTPQFEISGLARAIDALNFRISFPEFTSKLGVLNFETIGLGGVVGYCDRLIAVLLVELCQMLPGVKQ